jgi:HTH-type transcriptional regulator/antitoxin HigA
MSDSPIVLNEREARRARSTVARIDHALSGAGMLETAKTGLSSEVVEQYRKALRSARSALNRTLESYDRARVGEFDDLLSAWRSEPGVVLIIARIARGMSQSELAAKLGVREQQIQRYEADRYCSISLQNYRRVAAALGVEIEAKIRDRADAWLRQMTVSEPRFADDDIRKVCDHAKHHKWFEAPQGRDECRSYLLDYISESIARFGCPALLRTGLNALDLTSDILLAAWRARVIQRAELEAATIHNTFEPFDITWLPSLVSLSSRENGPRQAMSLLRSRGINIIVESQIAGLRLDGAAFRIREMPVIGMTIRHDRIDNFWFTLLHELAHVFLHQQSGLATGFFDDLDKVEPDEVEMEANEFAGSLLISTERWKMSPARISKSPRAVEEFAKQLGIHPAIVFGRIRNERNDYSIFSDRVGLGQVRRQLVAN